MFPIFRDGEIQGYTARAAEGSSPKYLTDWEEGAEPYMLLETGSDTLSLCEDYLSTLKCSKVCDALCLFGTNLKDCMFKVVVAGRYRRIRILLDNDNAEVRRKQTKLLNKLSLFCPDVEIVYLKKDPKLHTVEQLKELMGCP